MFKFFLLAFLGFLFSSTLAFADPNPPPPANNNPPNPTGETDATRLAAALKREEELKVELEALKNPKKPDPKDDDDLIKKARKEKEDGESLQVKTKQIERALGFNMGIDTFVKDNAELLPAEVAQIVALAHKESYDDAQSKASAIKASMIQSYFAIQANLDALTASQKTTLSDYLKLTKSGKEQKAAEVYENIFEPALEMVRKVKKAEEVGRGISGYGNPSAGSTAYKDRLVAMSRRTHLGEKEARA